ncbi:MAG TPA: disulfide bond formation protein DsbA, partial [Chryseobacterium sp.]|nr:disulfide bond formation protein DsbA [Chryseobacterium sp.]
SFQLDPTLDPKETKTTSEYFKEKKGFPEAQAQQMIAQVKQMGSGAGIDFNFEKALITNTFSAHKLLHLSKKYNKANEMEEAQKVLASEKYNQEISRDITEARNNGVSGVPFFVLNGKYAVSGAQPVELFASALQQTYDETVTPLKNILDNGASCDTDSCEI